MESLLFLSALVAIFGAILLIAKRSEEKRMGFKQKHEHSKSKNMKPQNSFKNHDAIQDHSKFQRESQHKYTSKKQLEAIREAWDKSEGFDDEEPEVLFCESVNIGNRQFRADIN